MIKKWLIEKLFKIIIGAIALGIGIWYISSSIGGASLSYTNMDLFMKQIGATDGNAANINGCFLCGYLNDLFETLGRATNMFWEAIVKNLLIVMAIGFGIFIVFHTLKFIREQATSKDVKDLTDKEPKIEFGKWFEKVWKTGLRIMIAGALIGGLEWAGPAALNTVTKIVVTPVMYTGTMLSMAATNVISHNQCETASVDVDTSSNDYNPLTPVLQPFMCVMGNLNTVMLAGASGGFALMNYSWLGLGGGLFTWLAGLTLVIMFMIIGFDLVFQVLTVLFKLIFIIIFIPLLIASAAFEEVWSLAKGVMNSSIDMLVKSAVSILKITLKVIIIYAVVYFAADEHFPTPRDGFTSIMPPLLGQITPENQDAKTMSVINVFKNCEQEATVDNEIDKDTFVSCFDRESEIVETRYPGAFDFMGDGFDFLIFMIGVFILYFWVISPEIEKLLSMDKEGKETFDYGKWLKDAGKTAYNAPGKTFNKVRDKIKEHK